MKDVLSNILGWICFSISLSSLIIWLCVIISRVLRKIRKAKDDYLHDNIEPVTHPSQNRSFQLKEMAQNFWEFCRLSPIENVNSSLLIFSGVFLILSMICDNGIIGKTPLLIQLSYSLFLVFIVLISPVLIINYMVKRYKDKSYNVLYIFVLICAIIFLFYAVIHIFVQNALVNRNITSDYFLIIIIFTFIMLLNTVYSMISILSVSMPKILKIVLGAISICFMSIFLYFAVGTYNISLDELNKIKNSASIIVFIKVSYYGLKGLTELPSSLDNNTLIFYTQFLIGKFYDIILVSLFIAFFYDALKSEDEHREI